jgi:tetratricopeptide (TPR) repeat protein
LLLAAFGVVQLASDAFDAGAAAPATLPRNISLDFGLRVYRALDHVAPAPYVEVTLAQAALERGDAAAAQRYAVRLSASPVKDELFARAALLRGQSGLAREYFLAAPDPDAVERAADSLAATDPASAYSLEQVLQARLARSQTHPDAVAETSWRMGQLANRRAWREISGSLRQRRWLERALRDFEAALALAPLSERYVIAAANQADLLGDRHRAAELFARGVDIDPASADAIAGLGVIAVENGDRSTAALDLARARALDARALMVRALERDLR